MTKRDLPQILQEPSVDRFAFDLRINTLAVVRRMQICHRMGAAAIERVSIVVVDDPSVLLQGHTKIHEAGDTVVRLNAGFIDLLRTGTLGLRAQAGRGIDITDLDAKLSAIASSAQAHELSHVADGRAIFAERDAYAASLGISPEAITEDFIHYEGEPTERRARLAAAEYEAGLAQGIEPLLVTITSKT